MNRYVPPGFVVQSSTVSVIATSALLAMLVAIVIMPRLQPFVMAVAAGATAAWGAWVGVRATDRDGFLRRGLRRIARIVVVILVAAAIRVASLGTSGGVFVVPLILPALVLATAFVAGRAVGRLHRRQADPLRTASVHLTADNALAGFIAFGAAVVVGITTIGHVATTLPAPPTWIPIAWLAAAVASLLAARPAILHGRTATTTAGSPRWFASLGPIISIAVAVMAVGWLVLALGLESALRDALPALPSVDLELFDAITESTGATRRPPPSDRSVRWQLALLVALAVAYLAVSIRRRRRRSKRLRPVGPGMSLLMFIRSLLAGDRSATVVTDDDEVELDAAAPVHAASEPARAFSGWMARFRRRPADPAAAILHDYRTVQRRLSVRRRRRASETVLAHAARDGTDDLATLADLVCNIRFAGHEPTTTDAERSRDLTRRLTNRNARTTT